MFDKNYDRVILYYASKQNSEEKMSYTENLGDFGQRERVMMEEILHQWNRGGLPNPFYEGGVKFAMNQNSGCVFLTNEDYQVCMMNGDKLAMWYSCPYNGTEGFFEDLLYEYADMHQEDQEYLREIADNEGRLILLCVRNDVGQPCYDVNNEEFGIVKGEDEAWLPSNGTVEAYFIEIEEFPCGEEDE